MSEQEQRDNEAAVKGGKAGRGASLAEVNVRGLQELRQEYEAQIGELEEYKRLKKEFEAKALDLVSEAAANANLTADKLATFSRQIARVGSEGSRLGAGRLTVQGGGSIVSELCITSCIGCVTCDGCIAATPL